MAMSLKQLEEKLNAGFYTRNLVKGMLKGLPESLKDRDERALVLQSWLDFGNSFENLVIDTDTLTDLDVAKKYIQLQKSAENRGKEFYLSLTDVKLLMKRKTCYYTGQRFTREGKNARTIDRVDSSKGYVKGNVVACTHSINSLKEQLLEGDNATFKGNLKALKKFLTKI